VVPFARLPRTDIGRHSPLRLPVRGKPVEDAAPVVRAVLAEEKPATTSHHEDGAAPAVIAIPGRLDPEFERPLARIEVADARKGEPAGGTENGGESPHSGGVGDARVRRGNLAAGSRSGVFETQKQGGFRIRISGKHG
jgi:hypothetical protein